MLRILSRQRILKPKAPTGRICISCSVSAVIIKEVYGACVQLCWMLAWVLKSSTSSEQNRAASTCCVWCFFLLCSHFHHCCHEQFLPSVSAAGCTEGAHAGAVLNKAAFTHEPHYRRDSTKERVKKTDIVCKKKYILSVRLIPNFSTNQKWTWQVP